ILTNAASSMGLGSVNRVLGGVFGAAKGVLLVTLAVMVCAHTDLPETEDWQSSYSIPYFQSLSEVIMPYLPGQKDKTEDKAES
ncbi:MAG: CvpA family protein, partial [Neisseria sp.]|nr:CvpA family protein [Neisseria sp.]